MLEPEWIPIETVLAIHEQQIKEHGGRSGIRDIGLLESALTAPQNLFYYENPKPHLSKIAAAYGSGLARNHPFIDGNKRVSLVVCELFLVINDAQLTATEKEKYQIFSDLAANNISIGKFCSWIKSHFNQI